MSLCKKSVSNTVSGVVVTEAESIVEEIEKAKEEMTGAQSACDSVIKNLQSVEHETDDQRRQLDSIQDAMDELRRGLARAYDHICEVKQVCSNTRHILD